VFQTGHGKTKDSELNGIVRQRTVVMCIRAVGTRTYLRGYVHYTICITCIMYQQLWGYKVEEKLYLGVREQKRLNTTVLQWLTC
jgi:hypothetical protein